MEQTKFAKALALLAGVVVFSGAISYLIFAWQPPSETPPGGNVDAPINTGATTQSKSGGLNIGKGVAIGTGGAISANDSNKRSLQIATDTGYGGIYNNHSGYLLFSTMPGGWGTSQLHFARSTNWGGYDSSNPTMTLSGANVGIGTTTPSYKLDVAGDIRLTGNGIYNSSGYQLIQGNATDWIRIGNASFTNGAAIYNNIATNGGLAVGTFTKPAAGNITASGNVGIGTTSPAAKLDVEGGIAIGSGSSINTTHGNQRSIQMSTDTSYGGIHNNHSGFLMYSTMPGGWGTSQLHFARSTNWGVYDSSNPTMTLSGRNVGIGTTGPTQKLDVNGQIRIRGGSPAAGKVLTATADGTASWQTPAGGTVASDCDPATQYAIGINADGTIKCKDIGGTPPWVTGSCDVSLPAGNKRIFVTGTIYTAMQVVNAASMDNFCQNAANSAGLPGTYRALVNDDCTSRTPMTYLPNATYWTCGTDDGGSSYSWKLVESTNSGFFTANGSGNYLGHPIKYDERGLPTSSAKTVWTNFRPTGSGSWSKIGCPCDSYGGCDCSGYRSVVCGQGSVPVVTRYGDSFAINDAWGGVTPDLQFNYTRACRGIDFGNCQAQPARALYCVQQ